MIFKFRKNKKNDNNSSINEDKNTPQTENTEQPIESANSPDETPLQDDKPLQNDNTKDSQPTTAEQPTEPPVASDTATTENEPTVEASPKATEKTTKTSYFQRLKAGLSKTGAGFSGLFLGKKTLDEDLLDDLETALLMADVGIEATQTIIDDITQTISRKETNNVEAVIAQLKKSMHEILEVCEKPLEVTAHQPMVILMVGINGAGKTTTIAKLTQRFQKEGKSVMLAAGDTFRAAAVEQLKTWGERANVPVIAQGTGADAASVIFDAYASAKAKQVDVLIADTAGRLHTQSHLMAEIEKIVRVLKKHDAGLPHEIMLVIDASNGQNALNQAKAFNQSLGLTGITVTKLDGTAKGGIIFSLAKQLAIPIRFIGVGEAAEDLRVFNIDDFVEALLANFKESND